MHCDLCKKEFATQVGMDYHISHKVCQKTSRKCPDCGKVLSSMVSYNYHIEHRVCHKSKKTITKPIPVQNKDHLIEELQTKVAVLEGKLQVLTDNPTTVNNNNIIVFPKEFGKEDMAYIQQKVGDVLGQLIKHDLFKSIPKLFTTVHNNHELPEYHNVYISSERSGYALVSDGQSFNHKPKKSIIDQIIEDKRSILTKYVNQNGVQLGEKILTRYERYTSSIDADEDVKRTLEAEIGGLLLDMKSVIANDEKTRKLMDQVDEGNYQLECQ